MNESRQDNPTITVLMSVFNGARWLDEAITSVLKQTFTDFEFIIVDDGSTDHSPEIIKRFQKQDPRIIVISKHNTGLADSLNCGIQKARGSWVARLDADDLCEPQRLEKQYQQAKTDPALVFIGSGLLVIDESGNPLKVYRYPTSHDELRKNLITARQFPAHSSAFYRTVISRSLGGYRTRIKRAQDRDLWLRLSEVGRLASIDEPLVRNRKHPDQISHEESGKRQRIDSLVAMTSYWLRQFGCVDPVASDEQEFELFRNWIARRLAEKRLFEYHASINRFRQLFARGRISIELLSGIARLLVQEPRFVGRYLRNTLFGQTISQRLACEWLDMKSAEKLRINKEIL